MGAKQSSPAANGRTRAYSGSDLPSSTSTTSNGNGRTAAMAMSYHAYGQSAHGASGTTATSSQHIGPRTRSVGGSSGGSGLRPQSGINIPNNSGAYSSQESGSSTPEEAERDRSSGGQGGPRLLIGSLPAHLSPHLFGVKEDETSEAGQSIWNSRLGYSKGQRIENNGLKQVIVMGESGTDSLLTALQI
ncbi:E3 ubiquitin-protein ligase znrf2-like isoform X2 [Salvelinus alpinus]|uniref:E3 ubiquitin-protein ligase znrf2-like isoform X2 n=1 Tax=Salvelinus alpinus TaxID=8036 RepID=UPI0039FD5A96